MPDSGGEHVDGGGEDAGVIVEVLLEVATKANDGLGRISMTMDRHHRTQFNGVEHPLGVVFRTIPKIRVHPEKRRCFRQLLLKQLNFIFFHLAGIKEFLVILKPIAVLPLFLGETVLKVKHSFAT